MKISLTILLTLSCIVSEGQSCDTIQDRVVNCVDSEGLKQGNWEIWKYEWRGKENYNPGIGFCGTAPLVKYPKRLQSRGSYRDNEKFGKWEYFLTIGHGQSIDRIESYHPDGSIEVTSHNSLCKTYFNPDSSIVRSTALAQDVDTVSISCINGQCTAYFDQTVIEEFELGNLDFVQYRIITGIYHREIDGLKK